MIFLLYFYYSIQDVVVTGSQRKEEIFEPHSRTCYCNSHLSKFYAYADRGSWFVCSSIFQACVGFIILNIAMNVFD